MPQMTERSAKWMASVKAKFAKATGRPLDAWTMFAIVTVLAAALIDLFRSRRSLLTEIALLRTNSPCWSGRSPGRA